MTALEISPVAKSWLHPIAPQLRSWFRSEGHSLNESQQAEEIDKRWRKEIVDLVCEPHGYEWGGCLVLAMAVAREPIA